MKKKILIFLLTAISLCVYASPYDPYVNEHTQSGVVIKHYLENYPTIDNNMSYIALDNDILTLNDKSLKITVTTKSDFYDMNFKNGSYWLDFYYTAATYTYTVEYRLSGTSSWVSSAVFTEEKPLSGYKHERISDVFAHTYSNSDMHSQTIEWELPNSLQRNVNYEIRVNVNISKHKYFEAFANYNTSTWDAAKQYIKDYSTFIEKNTMKKAPVFKIIDMTSSGKQNIRSNPEFNPTYDVFSTGVTTPVVYNHPDAAIAVNLTNDNIQPNKVITSGGNSSVYYGYTSMLASVGMTEDPCYTTYTYNYNSNAGLYDSYSKNCQVINLSTAASNEEHRKWLASNGISNTACTKYAGMIVRSLTSEQNSFEQTVSSLVQNSSDDNNLQKSWIFHLRDFNDVNYNKATLEAGTFLKFRNTIVYNTNAEFLDSQNYNKMFSLLGYCIYGPSFISDFCQKIQQNTQYKMRSDVLQFRLVDAVTFPNLSASEKTTKTVCTTDSLKLPSDILHIQGKECFTGTTSENLYGIEYRWEVSQDKQTWKDVQTSEVFKSYLLKDTDLPFTLVINPQDLLLRSSVLKNYSGKNLYFRQTAVLYTFSAPSNLGSNLYNFKGADGRYYIKITAPDVYTIFPFTKLTDENFAFSEGFTQEQNLCSSDKPNTNLTFNAKASSSVSADQIAAMNLEYSVARVNKSGVEVIVSNTNNYTIPYTGDSLKYICRIFNCRDTLVKEVRINALPLPTISIEKLSSSAQIATIDTDNKIITILALHGNKTDITLQESGLNTTFYFSRKVVKCKEPNITTTDFSSYSRSSCESYMSLRGWNFQKDTGYTLDDATIAQIRSYCANKENLENAALLEKSKEDCVRVNAWSEFDKENITTLENITDEQDEATFYIRKQNTQTGCFSDSVRIFIKYFNGIENNSIAFEKASDSEKDTIYVTSGSLLPAISGLMVSGGYGTPTNENNFSYLYQWIYSTSKGVWQNLYSYTDNGEATKVADVCLPAELLTIDRNISIARVVYSRTNGDLLTQVYDTSNVLCLFTETPIDQTKIKTVGNGKCSGSIYEYTIDEDLSSFKTPQNLQYKWQCDDINVSLSLSGEMDKRCLVSGITKSCIVTVIRKDTITGSCTDAVYLPIEIIEVKPYFTITIDNKTLDPLSLPNEDNILQPGTRIQFNNMTEGDNNRYDWVLQYQYGFGTEIAAQPSYQENPVCYVYNAGKNKIKLTAINQKENCKASIEMDNLIVAENGSRKIVEQSSFVDDLQDKKIQQTQKTEISVFPTIITSNNSDIYILTNMDNYTYSICNINGQTLSGGLSTEPNTSINTNGLSQGVYFVHVNENIYKIIKH